MDDLRIKAMDYALQARSNANEDIVELAERIYEFLSGRTDMPLPAALEILRTTPPPIPHQDLGKADQSPQFDDNVPTRLVRRLDCVTAD